MLGRASMDLSWILPPVQGCRKSKIFDLVGQPLRNPSQPNENARVSITLPGRLLALDTCAVSDALDHLQITGATTGIRPMWGRPKIAGYARTVEAVDAAAGAAGRHLGTSTVQAAGPGDVVVVSNRGRTNVSCWGDILTAAAQARGLQGVVIDGACRDLDAVADAGFPVYARAAVPVTARGRLAERAFDVPVLFDGVLVAVGDLVLADGSGVVLLKDRAEEIIEAAERLSRRQDQMRAAIRAGQPVTEVMHDARFHAALTGDE